MSQFKLCLQILLNVIIKSEAFYLVLLLAQSCTLRACIFIKRIFIKRTGYLKHY